MGFQVKDCKEAEKRRLLSGVEFKNNAQKRYYFYILIPRWLPTATMHGSS